MNTINNNNANSYSKSIGIKKNSKDLISSNIENISLQPNQNNNYNVYSNNTHTNSNKK